MPRLRSLLSFLALGTGEPDRLTCLLGTPGDFPSLFAQLFPLDAVHRCREELGKKYDLTLYTTAAAADDVDEVRASIGLSHGLFFSVTCAEDMPFITEEQIASRTAGSFLPRASSIGRASRGSTPRASRR